MHDHVEIMSEITAEILVVDDSPYNLDILLEVLSAAGYCILTALSGERALKYLSTNTPNLILLDVKMPGLDGFETCRRIKAMPHTAHIPIIFITADADTDSVLTGFSLGAVDYVRKPFQTAELLARVKTHLQLRHMSQLYALEQEKNRQLDQLNQMKDQFLAIMSHELRTPLNAILGMTESLIDEVVGSINPQQLRMLQIVEQSGTHLLSLINDILDLAKIESGQWDLEIQPISVEAICQASLKLIEPQANKKYIQLTLQLAEQLPPLLIDERRIHQILINLLDNAVKFTPEGGHVTVSARLATTATPGDVSSELCDRLRITVQDTGIGIAAADFDHIFEPFVQVDSTLNREYAGTGLGLALVKQIVERHHGQFGVVSEMGQGSCFWVDLPCCAAQSPFPDSPAHSQIININLPSSPPLPPLILIAEDNQANVVTLTSYLGAQGYRLGVVHDGQAALDCIQQEYPDLILMDIQMPVMDGIEAIAHIRNQMQLVNIPIIALTALAMESDRVRCLQAGANEYLSKPVRLKHLATRIQTYLGPLAPHNPQVIPADSIRQP